MRLVIITGPPGAGKSTYASEHARPGDVVIDLDRLASALTSSGEFTHDTDELHQSIAREGRAAIIRAARRQRAPGTAFLIVTLVEGWQASTADDVVTLDPGRDVVEARLAERPGDLSRARAGVTRWYRQHPPRRESNAEWLGL